MISIATALAVLVVAAELDPVALLKEVQAHQRDMDAVRENYTFHRIRRVEQVDKSGKVTKTTTQEREVFFVSGRQIGKLVKRDGVELSGPEQKREQDRVRELIEKFTKTPPKRPQGGGAGLISQVLAVAKISNPRRISLNGRRTMAFDFTGDPAAHAKGLEQKVGKKLEGTVWIDETDRQVARLEVRFYDNFHIGGGILASIQKGSNIKLEQAPVGEGLWLPAAEDDSLDARVVVKGMHVRAHMEDSDFKRFNVDAIQQIGAPPQ